MANTARKQHVSAEVRVIDELPPQELEKGILVRAKAAKGHETDAKPIGGFFVRRRWAGEEFRITKPEQFSATWMEFVDEPPQEWLDAMKINEERKAELMAKQQHQAENNSAQALVMALSQLMSGGKAMQPGQFNYADGLVKPTAEKA